MNASATDIIRAQSHQGSLLADILADAFKHDVVMNYVIPRPTLYAGFFKMLLEKLYFAQGLVDLEPQHRGAALWLPPGRVHVVPMCAAQIALVLRLMLHTGPGILTRLLGAQETMAKHHPHEPHYYLHAIGARQACQGQGIGSALLKVGTRRCDEEQMPAYLESSSEANCRLYARHGFELVDEQPIVPGGPSIHLMWREPRPI